MPRKKKNKGYLPKRLIVLDCVDKGFQERWEDGRDPLNIPASYRAILSGRVFKRKKSDGPQYFPQSRPSI